MSTTTPRLGLVKPATSENYDVAVPNANMDLLDGAPANLTICTSTTRPSAPDVGDGIFETDSGPNVLWFHGATWKAGMGKWFICTSSTRPGSTLTFGGFPIYETDTGNRLVRNSANTGWIALSPYSVADAAAQTALGTLTEGFITYRRDVHLYYHYAEDGTHYPLTPARKPAVELAQSSAHSIPNNLWTPINFSTENYDPLNWHSTSSNNSRVTVPAGYPTGQYSVNGVVATASGSSAAAGNVSIAKNGVRVANSTCRLNFPADGFGGAFPTRAALVQLAAGDYVEIQFIQNSGSAINTFVGGDETSGLSLVLQRFV